MPAFFSHYRFGVYCYKRMENSDLKRAIHHYPHAFCMGCQGPDLFFYHVLGGLLSERNYGSRLHSENTGLFLNQLALETLQTVEKEERDVKAAYTAGFITHYLLDCHTHGYVYSIVGAKKSKHTTGRHFGLESDIDLRLLEKMENKTPKDYRPAQIVALSKLEKEAVSRLLSACVTKTLQGGLLTKKQAKQTTNEMRLALRLIEDKHEKKGKAFRFIEKHTMGFLLATPLLQNNMQYDFVDPCNEKHQKWKNPFGEEESEASFFDLMELAEAEFLMIAQALDMVVYEKGEMTDAVSRLRRLLGNRSYKSGYEL